MPFFSFLPPFFRLVTFFLLRRRRSLKLVVYPMFVDVVC